MSLLLVFDLDGVLVDSRAANEAAYSSIGVYCPADFHTTAWETWCSQENHDKKNAALVNHLHLLRPLPLLELALQRRAPVLSACSREALVAMRGVMPDLARLQIQYGLRDKVNSLLALGRTGVYFDDCPVTCDKVRTGTEWQACLVK